MLAVRGIVRPRGALLDFANFYDAGQKARVGAFETLYDPFALIAGAEPFGHMTFFSAPLTSYLYVPMAMLTPSAATALFKLLGTLAEIVGLILLYRHIRPLAGSSDEDQSAFFGLLACAALLFQPFWVLFSVGGQTTPFVFLSLVIAYLAYLRSRFASVAILLSLVVLIKPAFAPAAILLFVISSGHFRLTALACGLGVAAVSLWRFGLPLHLEFLGRVMDETRFATPPWMNSNPFSWIEALYLPPDAYKAQTLVPPTARWLEGVLKVATASGLIWAMQRHRQREISTAAARHVVFVTALALVVVLSPVVWSHYLTVLFIPLTVLIALRRHLGWLTWAAVVAGVMVALGQSLILVDKLVRVLVMDSTDKILAMAVMKSMPSILIVAVILLSHRSLDRALHDPVWRRL